MLFADDVIISKYTRLLQLDFKMIVVGVNGGFIVIALKLEGLKILKSEQNK